MPLCRYPRHVRQPSQHPLDIILGRLVALHEAHGAHPTGNDLGELLLDSVSSQHPIDLRKPAVPVRPPLNLFHLDRRPPQVMDEVGPRSIIVLTLMKADPFLHSVDAHPLSPVLEVQALGLLPRAVRAPWISEQG
jgi:hypothetical protein